MNPRAEVGIAPVHDNQGSLLDPALGCTHVESLMDALPQLPVLPHAPVHHHQRAVLDPDFGCIHVESGFGCIHIKTYMCIYAKSQINTPMVLGVFIPKSTGYPSTAARTAPPPWFELVGWGVEANPTP